MVAGAENDLMNFAQLRTIAEDDGACYTSIAGKSTILELEALHATYTRAIRR